MNLTDKTLLTSKAIEAAGKLFGSRGYAGTQMKDIALEASIELEALDAVAESKEVLCVAWLSDIHQRSEERHQAIIDADETPLEKVEDYFTHLKEWMLEYGFGGCPFSNTASSMGTEDSERVRNEIRMHKHFVCDFLVELAANFTNTEREAERLGRELFLLYSAATTEAKNFQEVWPIEQASELALEACRASQRALVTTL